MKNRVTSMIMGLAALGAPGGAAWGQVDGAYQGAYGPARALQDTPTGFGDSNLGQINFANGSELDGAYVSISGGNLNLLLTGNLESNFNKLELFIDTGAAGQNVLRTDNPNVDFDGLNRMGGMRFDAPFSPRYWISVTGGDVGGGMYGFFANGAELLPGGGGNGQFLGGNDGQSAGALTGGTNFLGVLAAINNSNIAGVSGMSVGDPGAVTTGIELQVPLASLGLAPGSVFRLAAMINGGGHDFLSNQVLAGIGGAGNLGDPRNVDFTTIPGDQFVTIPAPGSLMVLAVAGLAGVRRRR